jgi:hypothetical protein
MARGRSAGAKERDNRQKGKADKSHIDCFNCGKMGHYQKQCNQPKADIAETPRGGNKKRSSYGRSPDSPRANKQQRKQQRRLPVRADKKPQQLDWSPGGVMDKDEQGYDEGDESNMISLSNDEGDSPPEDSEDERIISIPGASEAQREISDCWWCITCYVQGDSSSRHMPAHCPQEQGEIR